MALKGSQTEKNVLAAFAGECQAHGRYLFFAKQAKKEGFEAVAAHFEEVAAQEQSHAKQLFRLLEGGSVEITAGFPAGTIGSTLENLRAAAAGEHEEVTRLYPAFARTAEQEGHRQVAGLFRLLIVAEQAHERRMRTWADQIESGRVFRRPEPRVWVCRKCGYIHEGTEPPSVCPLCKHPQGYFEVETPID